MYRAYISMVIVFRTYGCTSFLIGITLRTRIERELKLDPKHRCKKLFYVFYYFYKKRVFHVFYFCERFLFFSGEIFYPTKPAKILLNLLNSCIKRLLSDGFNMAAIKILS